MYDRSKIDFSKADDLASALLILFGSHSTEILPNIEVVFLGIDNTALWELTQDNEWRGRNRFILGLYDNDALPHIHNCYLRSLPDTDKQILNLEELDQIDLLNLLLTAYIPTEPIEISSMPTASLPYIQTIESDNYDNQPLIWTTTSNTVGYSSTLNTAITTFTDPVHFEKPVTYEIVPVPATPTIKTSSHTNTSEKD